MHIAETLAIHAFFTTDQRKLGVSQSLGRDPSSHRTVTVSELCRIVVPAPWSAPLPVVALTASLNEEPGARLVGLGSEKCVYHGGLEGAKEFNRNRTPRQSGHPSPPRTEGSCGMTTDGCIKMPILAIRLAKVGAGAATGR